MIPKSGNNGNKNSSKSIGNERETAAEKTNNQSTTTLGTTILGTTILESTANQSTTILENQSKDKELFSISSSAKSSTISSLKPLSEVKEPLLSKTGQEEPLLSKTGQEEPLKSKKFWSFTRSSSNSSNSSSSSQFKLFKSFSMSSIKSNGKPNQQQSSNISTNTSSEPSSLPTSPPRSRNSLLNLASLMNPASEKPQVISICETKH